MSTRSRHPFANRLRSQRGFTMAGLMLAILLLVVFSSFAVRQTALDQRSTSHIDTANRALFAAESGIAHALNKINAAGVINFQADVSNRWGTIFGIAPLAMGLDPSSTNSSCRRPGRCRSAVHRGARGDHQHPQLQILIADGSITINGTLDFIGLIIVRGNTTINSLADPDDDTVVLGNAMIMGSLWTGNLEITVGGSAIVDYCHECLWLMDNTGDTAGGVPRPMRIVSWRDL